MRTAITSSYANRAVLASTLFAMATGCGVEPSDESELESLGSGESALINGAVTSDYPNVGIITFPGAFCSSTLIADNAVLTAAHCILAGTPSDYLFYPGTSLVDGEAMAARGVAIVSSRAIPVLRGDVGAISDDAAVIILDRRLSIAPAPIGAIQPAFRDVIVGVGYGQSSASGATYDQRPRVGSFNVQNVDRGVILTSSRGLDPMNAPGDSGGPKFFKGALVGITSAVQSDFGLGYNASANAPAVVEVLTRAKNAGANIPFIPPSAILPPRACTGGRNAALPEDVNGDGAVTSADVALLEGILAKTASAKGTRPDVDGDCQVTAADVEKVRAFLRAKCTNPANRFDVNNDGRVTSLDALVIINGTSPTRYGPEGRACGPNYFPDVNQDGRSNSTDALVIINRL